MQVSYYCEPSPARAHPTENEDYVVTGPDWAFVLDGATPQPQFPIGCIHGVAWYARQLAGWLGLDVEAVRRAVAQVARASTSFTD